jgi:hypothetical protein
MLFVLEGLVEAAGVVLQRPIENRQLIDFAFSHMDKNAHISRFIVRLLYDGSPINRK